MYCQDDLFILCLLSRRMFLKDSQLQEFEEIFEYLDVDRSGDISHKELRQAFEDMEIEMDDEQFDRMVV